MTALYAPLLGTGNWRRLCYRFQSKCSCLSSGTEQKKGVNPCDWQTAGNLCCGFPQHICLLHFRFQVSVSPGQPRPTFWQFDKEVTSLWWMQSTVWFWIWISELRSRQEYAAGEAGGSLVGRSARAWPLGLKLSLPVLLPLPLHNASFSRFHVGILEFEIILQSWEILYFFPVTWISMLTPFPFILLESRIFVGTLQLEWSCDWFSVRVHHRTVGMIYPHDSAIFTTAYDFLKRLSSQRARWQFLQWLEPYSSISKSHSSFFCTLIA